MPEPYVRPRPQALEAMEILLERGEYAMLPYIMSRIDPDAPPQQWLKGGLCLLQDASTVTHVNGRYRFHWWEDHEEREVFRLAAMPASGRPDPQATPAPLITDPSLEDVWSRFMQDLEESLEIDLDEPLLERDDTYRLAPDLFGIIRHVSLDGRADRAVDKYHSPILSDCAGSVASLLPAEQLQAIKDAVLERANAA